MNRSTLQFVLLFLLLSITGAAQTFEPFTIRKNIELKGNMVVVGNSILGQDNLPFNDLSKDNQDISMQYIDIDGISSTFSSSSADVVIPNQPDGSSTTCYRVVYAGLYWSAILQSGDRSSINQIKFKTPASRVYNDVIGEIIYDAIVDPIPSFSGEPANIPYACYANVTNLLTGLSSLEGTYTAANITSSEGSNFSTGLAAGWTLVIIYEDPNLDTKSFTTFDGFSHIYDSHFEEIPISGFNTPPSGSIDIQMAYAALDGDRSKRATKLEIDGKEVTSSFRPANKFFGSVIENSDGVSYPRNPFSANTLGYDTGFLEIKNAEPEYIKNGDTSSGFTLQVARGQADPVFTFLNSFAVDVIAPDIVLTKIVTDDTGTEIDGADVVLGQRLFYEITYQSVGNDNVVNFTLKDVLPDNIYFDPATDIDLSNAGGATLQSYDPSTRTLIFNIPSGSVQVGDPEFVIRLATQVVSDCYDLSQACSNEITNQAFASYSGVINNALVVDEGSFATTECFGVPGSTNFLVDITNCNYQRDQVLCGASVDLVAADGYDSYSWSSSPSGTPVIGTDQTFTAVNTGTYYVKNTTLSTCTSINEEITVIPYGSTLTNPIIPFADEVNICPNDGKTLPDIYLCGVNATREINTGIADAVSIIWEKLDESSCSAVGIDNCANESSSCSWNQIATGPNYVSDTSGQFRIVINYPGGCFSNYYFNVYANLLAPTISARDIICNTQGQVTAGGFPADYEYSLDPLGPYQSSNVFAINSPGYYTIYSKQVGVDSNPCIFETPSIYVRQRDVSITSNISQPLCFGDKGTISVAINDGLPQYNFSILLGGTLVSSSGLTNQSDHTFANLNKGIYTVNVSTDDGCIFSNDIEIIEPAHLTVNSALTKALTCEDGEITVYPIGGTPPYLYYVNGGTDFQDIPIIPVTASGTFNIRVVDSNNCRAETSIEVEQIDEPVFNIDETNILCYGSNSGQIQFNVTNSNGYTIEYSIDNGVTYSNNPIFSNLIAGTYQAVIRYSLNGTQCLSTSRSITVLEPVASVTASAGVSQLAGCGPSGEGSVRITNPQGGIPPYEFSFDNQATWTSSNEVFLAPGTYTLYVRDSNGCVFPTMDVTIDQEPLAPTIDISDPEFNCDGSANSTVTVTNLGSNSFAYTYLLDGVENPNTADPTVFENVPNGAHTISVTYQLLSVPTYSNLLFENFGYGDDTFSPGINSTYYCFERQVAATQCGNSTHINDGEYSVTANIEQPFGAWLNPTDHTPGTNPPPKGRYLVVNIGASIPTTAILYEKTINDIIPNQPINVEFFAMNLVKASSSLFDPNLTVALVDGSGTEISSFSTGNIPKTEVWENYPKTPLTLDPGANTSLKFIVRSNVQQTSGNDVAIDDIRVYQLPTACIKQRDFPIVIDSGNAFTAAIVSTTNASCAGSSDGTIKISAQNFDATNGFQYSIDGINWITQLTSPHDIPGLARGNYNVQIRFDNIETGCDFSFNQSISEPAPLSVNVSSSPMTCLNGATVTAVGSGGTPAYSYELLDTTLNLVSNFPSTGILTNVAQGDYIIRVTDINNCTETAALNLVNAIPPTATIINTDYCYDSADKASLEVSASGGQLPYQYNINGGPFQTNPIFNNLTPGDYNIIVRDAFGCEFTIPTETIAPQVTINVALTKELDCTSSADAIISGTISRGYPDASSNYQYEVAFNGGGFSSLGSTGINFTYSATAAGTYQFQVIDDNNCKVLSNEVTVSPIVLPTATVNTVNPSCNGNSNGTVQIIPSSGVGPYTFSFNGSSFSSTSIYTGLSANINYSYQVRDSKNCIFSGSITLTEPTILASTATATNFSCNASNGKQSALITIAVPTTGTAPYTYSFDGGTNFSSSNTFTVNDDGSNQTISYAVKDVNGCETLPQDITIDALNPPTDLDLVASTITCNNPTSTVNITTINGVGTLQFETLAPSPIIFSKQTSSTFTGLTAGTYVFRVTDASGCYYTESINIPPVTEIAVTGRIANNVSCNGGNDGAIGFRINRFTSTYSYSFNGAPIVTAENNPRLLFTGLTAGIQTITVTDETTGCTETATVTVTEPTNALIINSATATKVHCNQYNSQITVAASNGTASYTYAAVVAGDPVPGVADYNSSNVINVDTNTGSNLVWDVYVKDANACIASTTATISLDTPPTVTVPALSPDQCSVLSGFTFTANGTGIAPLSYSINGGASYQSSPIFTVNTPGNYTVTVRDGNGCTAISSNSLEVFEPLTASATLTKDISCVLGDEDASIDITAAGGNGPYTYEVSDDNGATYSTIAGPSYTTAVADTYQFKITDDNGCEYETNPITVSAPINPDITNVVQTQAILCNGEETGALNISINNALGLSPFDINVFNNTESRDYGTQTSGLDAGDYTITVTDANGCTDTDTIIISEPSSLNVAYTAVPVTCIGPGLTQGSVIIDSVVGGNGPYNYFVTSSNGYSKSELNNLGTTSVNFDVVDFGLYQILVVDTNGCSFLIQDVLIASPPNDLDITVMAPPADCSTGGSATVTIGAPLAGSGPYHFAIYTGSGMTYTAPTVFPWQDETTPGSEDTIFTDLIPGATYTFIVYDELTQCYYYEVSTLSIPTNSTLTTSATTSNNIACTGSIDGNVSFDITSIYPVTTDVTYEVFDSLSLVTTGITGSGTVPATGSLTVSNLGPLPVGSYIVVVTEAVGATNAGCSVTTSPVSITESAFLLSITASVSKNENCNELGVITAVARDGTAPYEFILLSDTDPAPIASDLNWASANTFSTSADDYTVYVKDAYGCIQEVDITLDRDLEPTINTVPPQCFNGTPINITLVEGTGTAIAPLSYSIGGAYQSSNTFNISTAGTYNLSIKDGNGCIVSTTYEVTPPLLLDANMTQDLTCDVDASISLTPGGGSGAYTTYEWSNDGGLNYTVIGGAVFTTNLSGTYQFRVTDSQTCQATSASIIVTPNTTPTLTETHVDVTCNGDSDGSIVVTPDNGVAPYEFSIDGGTTFQASNVFNGLSFLGSPYSVVVRDAKRCESLASSVTIGQPSALVVNASSPGFLCDVSNIKQGALVTIDIPSTGTAPYSYSFDGVNYSSTRSLTVFDDGTDQTINYFVKDTNGCTESGSLILEGLNAPTDLTFNPITTVTCTVPTSNVELTATNGVGILSYEIIAPISVGPQPSNIFTGLAPETYTFRVTDENGCFYTASYTVEPVTNITVRGRVANDVSCNGGNDAIVGFRVGDFSTTYSYVFDSDPAVLTQTDLVILKSGLSAGNHTLTVTDEVTGCTATTAVTVIEPTNALAIDSAVGTNVHCNNDNAVITVTASGGTPNYEYAAVISGSTPTPSDYVSNNVLSVDTNSGSNLTWDVYVKDASCITPTFTTVTIINDPLPTVSIPALAANQCNVTGDLYEFTVTTSTGVGTLEYSIGNGYQTSDTFTDLLPGAYSVTVKDENGCTAISPTSITINESLDVSPSITTLPSCSLVGDGVITLSASGGTGTYSYTISPSAGTSVSGNTISGLSSNILYTITLDDTVCTKNATITLDPPTPVIFTTTPKAVSCNGGSDGVITVNLPVTNDNPIYTYEIIAGPMLVGNQTSNVFSGLIAGVYTVQVTSGRSCIETEIVTVNQPDEIIIPMPTVVEYACTADTNSTNFATITVNGVVGGSSNYTIYEFIKGGTVVQATSSNLYTETDLLGGTYTINIYDDKGCQGDTAATIQPFIQLNTLDVVIDNAITCINDEDITVSVTSTGGTPTNLEYTLEDVSGAIANQTNINGIFTSLPIGDYIITAENTDTGCSLQTVHYVNDPNTFDVTIDNVANVTCFSDSDGSIDITFIDRTPNPTDESGPFTYTIDDVLGNPVTSGTAANLGPITISGLSSGTYNITASLTNTPFCSISKNFTITAPTEALSISETHTEITCVSGNNDGSISAGASGGWPGDYEFQLEFAAGGIISAYANMSNFSGLVAGDYLISVRDSKGCVASTNVLLVNPQAITADIATTLTPVLCFGDTNSSIEVTNVRGGQGSNYTFTLNRILPVATSSGPQTSSTFTGLGAGTYNVLIQDGYSCEFTTRNVVITEPSLVEALLVQSTSETCTSGSTLTLSAKGGTGSYEYSDDAFFANVIGSFTTDVTITVFPETTSITYKYYVRDANACNSQVSNEITIDPVPKLQVNIDATNAFINCKGDNTGVIVASAIGGLGNYTYILQDEIGIDITPAPTQSNPGVFTDLPAGTYQVRVTSGIDCEEVSEQVEITEPSFTLETSFSTTDVTCAGGDNGSIEIIATGGTGLIKYAISPQLNQFFEFPIFEDLTEGTYQAIVQDELGCFVLIDFVINEPTEVLLSIVPNSIVPEICSGDLDGAFSVNITGGTMPYSYSLDDIDGTYALGTPAQTQFDFDNLSGGNHIVYVRDAQDCESEWNITLPESVLLEPQVAIEYGCTTNLSTNTVTVSVHSSITDLSDVDYSLDGSLFQSSNMFTDVPSGSDHIITVRHTNGCEELSQEFDIDQIDPLHITINDGELNQIVSSVSGGVAPYTYSVNGEEYGDEEKFYIYSSGDYTVNVTDANGCVSAVTRYFEYVDVCISNYFTPNGDGTLDEWGPGCTTQYKDLTVHVFDRYGREIVLLRVNEKWDGNYKNKALPSGDYWYILKLNDPKDDREFIGHFTLYR
ncbi:T9SS type B sorting domain-containing protein [uncultured Algibacter sp.]|uniref:T9SS type B sorting domain-containing protein n=1 Tax=uncultured Algibacter sp. TaxID=298659 RepID=UPI002634E120|nr:T9SS type B sorting domain-containing protein [uncultured Algibacter sp.]